MSNRLVVISNRVAPPEKGKPSSGGLAVAVHAAMRKAGGIWFGWSGEVDAAQTTDPTIHTEGSITYATMALSQRDYEEYYNGFANSTLWPLFHYRLDLTEFSRRTYAGYLRVNALFASKLAPMLAADDLVWVHDYHLIPFGEQLRQMGCEQRIGFFLHTPFPVPEILLALPNHEALIRALCAYDLVGFQTERDRRAFVEYLLNEAGAEVIDEKRLRAFGRIVRVEAFPISVETEEIVELAAKGLASRQAIRLRDSLLDREMVVGVDRLDYSKGLPQRFQAFETLLENYADNRGRVVLMQIAPPTRTDVQEYIDIRQELESLSGHINGTYAEFDWTPIRYLNKSFPRRSLLAFYRLSKVGLVTPLRDGMNLVAKEYVAAQDPDDPGVLVLSRFAGAAAELAAGALIVNPYDVEQVAESLQRALSMPLAERQERHAASMEILRHNTITHWREQFVEALAGR